MSGDKQRHIKQHPCAVCGGYDGQRRGHGERCFGYTADDWVYCTREELAGAAPYSDNANAWRHKRDGDCRCGRQHGWQPVPMPTPRPAKRKQPARTSRATADDWQPDVAYPYRDAAGAVVYEVCRWGTGPDKRIRQRQPNVAGGWWADMEGVERILYRLPELGAADPAAAVYVTAGEKDADRLAAAGLVATTNPEGEGPGKWRPEFTPEFAGRPVVVLEDNDETGRAHAQAVAQALAGTAARIQVLRLPGLPEHGDVSDWLDAGHTLDDLVQLAAVWPDWQPPTEPARCGFGAAPLAQARATLDRDLEAARAELAALRTAHAAQKQLLLSIEAICRSTTLDPTVKPLAIGLALAATTDLRLRGVQDAPRHLYLAQAAELEGANPARPEGTSKRLRALAAANFLTLTRQPRTIERLGRDGTPRTFRTHDLSVQLGPRPGEAPLSVAEQLKLLANPTAEQARRKNWGGARTKPVCPECGDDTQVGRRAHWYCRQHDRDLGPVAATEPASCGGYTEPNPQDVGLVAGTEAPGDIDTRPVCTCGTALSPGEACFVCELSACRECGAEVVGVFSRWCRAGCRHPRPSRPERYERPPLELVQAYAGPATTEPARCGVGPAARAAAPHPVLRCWRRDCGQPATSHSVGLPTCPAHASVDAVAAGGDG